MVHPEPSVLSYGVSKSGAPNDSVNIPIFIPYGNGIITNTLSGMKIQLNKIREYILNNPMNWEIDENYRI